MGDAVLTRKETKKKYEQPYHNPCKKVRRENENSTIIIYNKLKTFHSIV